MARATATAMRESPSTGGPALPAARSGQGGEHPVEPVHEQVDLRLGDDERRHETQHRVAGEVDERALLEHPLNDGRAEFDAAALTASEAAA